MHYFFKKIQWNPDFSNPHFFEPPDNSNPSSVEHCNFTPDFLNSPIFRTNFRFPWRFEKSELHRNFIIIKITIFSIVIGLKKLLFSTNSLARLLLGSISAALSCLVYVPSRKERVRGRSAGSFPEQRLEIEPRLLSDSLLLDSLLSDSSISQSHSKL